MKTNSSSVVLLLFSVCFLLVTASSALVTFDPDSMLHKICVAILYAAGACVVMSKNKDYFPVILFLLISVFIAIPALWGTLMVFDFDTRYMGAEQLIRFDHLRIILVFTLSLALALFMFVRTQFDLFKNRHAFQGFIKPIWFYLWCLVVLIACVGVLYVRGDFLNAGKADGFKAALTVASFFYGLILASDGGGWSRERERMVIRFIAILCVLVAFSVLRRQIMFLLIPVSVTVGCYATYRRQIISAAILHAFGAYFLVVGTFNARFAYLAAWGMLLLVFVFSGRLGTRQYRWLSLGLILLPMSLIFYTITTIDEVDYRGFGNEDIYGVQTRFMYKLYEDRGEIWHATWSEVQENPWLMGHPGKPIQLKDMLWLQGPHSGILYVLLNLGWVGGGLLLFITFFCVSQSMKLVFRKSWSLSRALLIGLCSAYFVYIVATDLLFLDASGVLFFFTLGYFSMMRYRELGILQQYEF